MGEILGCSFTMLTMRWLLGCGRLLHYHRELTSAWDKGGFEYSQTLFFFLVRRIQPIFPEQYKV